MVSRASWVRGGIVALLAALVLGRWLVVSVVEGLWAASLGAGVAHGQISEVQNWLLAVALFFAASWFLGNLFLVYRSIGSVHVPRRVGNIEILETLPRHYLLLGFVTIGVTLAMPAASSP